MTNKIWAGLGWAGLAGVVWAGWLAAEIGLAGLAGAGLGGAGWAGWVFLGSLAAVLLYCAALCCAVLGYAAVLC